MLHRASSVVSQTKGGPKGTSHEGTPASRHAADRSPFAQGRPRDSSPQASQAGSQARPALTGSRTHFHCLRSGVIALGCNAASCSLFTALR